MELKYYTDTHIAKAIAIQLRASGVEIIRSEEVGMAEADDESHLIYAAQNSYVMVTQDADFAALHAAWIEAGKAHNGIMLVPRHLQGEAQVSYVVKCLLEYHRLITGGVGTVEEDIVNRLIWL
jgi:hypothetical protein